MPMFRKKPVEIEAIQFVYTDECMNELKQFCGEHISTFRKARNINSKATVYIRALEDSVIEQQGHLATEGDWIIKGIKGEFYACKPNIFDETYELVAQEPMVKEKPMEFLVEGKPFEAVCEDEKTGKYVLREI